MFTGLVGAKGTVRRAERDGDGLRLTIATPLELGSGDSIAVDGVCLTAAEVGEGSFRADVMGESLRRSTLGDLAAGDEVNLELPLRAGDRMGGHFVQGHVDGTGTVDLVGEDGFARVVRVEAPAELLRYVVEKGSIAVDGVSLTVVEVDDDAFTVSLVPETLDRTTLGALVAGGLVNVEVDLLAKYAEKLRLPV